MSKLQDWKTNLTRKQRVILLIVVAVVVLALLTATVFRDNVVSFFRWATYSQQNDSFSHNAQSNSLFMGLEDNLLICTQSQIQLVSPTGTSRVQESVEMTTPALNASGEYAVVYDVGGQELRVIGGEALLHSLTLSEEESILCATINEDGWVAVTSKVSGYKGVVTVYNQNFETVMTIRLSSRYISDAIVTKGFTSSLRDRQRAPLKTLYSTTPSHPTRHLPAPFPWVPMWCSPPTVPAGAGSLEMRAC